MLIRPGFAAFLILGAALAHAVDEPSQAGRKDIPGITLPKEPIIGQGSSWARQAIFKMEAACRDAESVKLEVEGNYRKTIGSHDPYVYRLKAVFQGPNRVYGELVETLEGKSTTLTLVSDGKRLWSHRSATGEVKVTAAAEDRDAFLTQIHPLLLGDNGFLLHGLKGDWHWFMSFDLENDGVEVSGGRTLQRYRAKLSAPAASEFERRHKERYLLVIDPETSLPVRMSVSYNHQAPAEGFQGDFTAKFDFATVPDPTMFSKPPPTPRSTALLTKSTSDKPDAPK